MARHAFYCQCYLKRKSKDVPCGEQTLVSWIPSHIAIVGKHVRLRDSKDEPWSEPWLVSEMWKKEKGDIVEAKNRDYLHQRESSDV